MAGLEEKPLWSNCPANMYQFSGLKLWWKQQTSPVDFAQRNKNHAGAEVAIFELLSCSIPF